MNGSRNPFRSGPSPPLFRFLVLAVLLLACLFPPETRGESAAGCGALLALLAVLTCRGSGGGADAILALALALVWPLALTAEAPGAAVEPMAIALLAAAAGTLVASRATSLREGEAMPRLLAGAATLVSVHAIYQWLHGLDALAASLEKIAALPDRDLVLARIREGRAFGAFATPAALGGFLVIALPPTLGLAISRGGWRRMLLAVSATLQGTALVASSSATAVAALLAAVLAFFWRRGRAPRGAILSVTLSFLVLVSAIVILRGSKVVDVTDPGSPWRLRAGNLRVAASMLAEHPWLGVGPGGFGESYPAYRRSGDNEARHAHNLPLELLAEHGLGFGALLTVTFFWLFLGPVWRRGGEGPAWTGGLTIGLAAFAFQNLADFTAFFPSLLWTAAILRGALSAPGADHSTVPPVRLLAATRVALTVLAAAVCALSGLGWNAQMAARHAAAEGNLEEASLLSQRAVRLEPWDVDARMLRAEVLREERADPSREALDAVESAIRLSPIRPAARALRARIRLGFQDWPGAYTDLCEAARLYPVREDYARERDTLAARLPRAARAAESQR